MKIVWEGKADSKIDFLAEKELCVYIYENGLEEIAFVTALNDQEDSCDVINRNLRDNIGIKDITYKDCIKLYVSPHLILLDEFWFCEDRMDKAIGIQERFRMAFGKAIRTIAKESEKLTRSEEIRLRWKQFAFDENSSNISIELEDDWSENEIAWQEYNFLNIALKYTTHIVLWEKGYGKNTLVRVFNEKLQREGRNYQLISDTTIEKFINEIVKDKITKDDVIKEIEEVQQKIHMENGLSIYYTDKLGSRYYKKDNTDYHFSLYNLTKIVMLFLKEIIQNKQEWMQEVKKAIFNVSLSSGEGKAYQLLPSDVEVLMNEIIEILRSSIEITLYMESKMNAVGENFKKMVKYVNDLQFIVMPFVKVIINDMREGEDYKNVMEEKESHTIELIRYSNKYRDERTRLVQDVFRLETEAGKKKDNRSAVRILGSDKIHASNRYGNNDNEEKELNRIKEKAREYWKERSLQAIPVLIPTEEVTNINQGIKKCITRVQFFLVTSVETIIQKIGFTSLKELEEQKKNV